ncbi:MULTISPECIES: CoA transferase [Sphingomonadales]|jgi:crotonobetainyl-CoA:carnitine CoA-transferase CaiB-like acyl-CoA transferase|uniref:L-carnitine dehydratase/bile acid-inducible protein F taxon n=1 Tax=Sphingopyxis fribergensis TaxID=1515612 RepID=A0A0A7PB11_9SPHN|nr:CoA transferase [Sphingopyxis fribergensis]AJA07160.1 L-carnitine dehydratase/bile acid-inducible protein F taxon [Sphingopyxis fribergensis]MDF0546178.1 CoA transferase [Sphingobium arseniciresistens]
MSNIIEARIKTALAEPLTSDDRIDPAKELQEVLSSVGLGSHDADGTISFIGKDPVISSPWPLATMAGVSLMAKAVAFAGIWKTRTGEGQDLSVDLRRVLHRLCPFYDKKWEMLNGYAPGTPSDPTNPFMPSHMYQTRDGRWIQLLNIYPRTKSAALALLGCNDSVSAISAAVRGYDGLDLEQRFNEAGLQATLVRTVEEFVATEQFGYLKDMPLVEITKIGDSDPVPFTADPKTPLDGIRALGLGRVIAGAGLGRALAYHGADVLNIWGPNDFEMDLTYYTANVGMRSATMDLKRADELARFKALAQDADIMFSNRRPGFLGRYNLTAEQMAELNPGLIHVDMSLYGWHGPWADRIGFDQNAGGVSGVFAREGTPERPQLTEIFVVNDYAMSWISSVAVAAALQRRAVEGGSYRIRISLARLSIWLLKMGIFDKSYAASIAGTPGDHEYLAPEMFEANTPCGHYQGVTDQVQMSRTPGFYATPLVPRGSNKPEWLPRR